MAILCADWQTMDTCADALHQRRLPFNVSKRSGDYNPSVQAPAGGLGNSGDLMGMLGGLLQRR